MPHSDTAERRERSLIVVLLGYGELVLETAVAFALAIGGVILFCVVVYDFVNGSEESLDNLVEIGLRPQLG